MNKIENMQHDEIELRSFVTFRLSRTYAELNRQAFKTLAKITKLSLSQWRILSVIEMEDTISAAQVARYADLDKGQISRAVKGLSELGFVSSHDHENDRRSSLLSLTKSGREEHARVLKVMRKRQKLLTDGIHQDDLEKFRRILDVLSKRAREDVL